MKFKIFLIFFAVFLSVASNTSAETKSFTSVQPEFLIQTSADKKITEIVLVKSKSDAHVAVKASWQGFDLAPSQAVSQEIIRKRSIDFVTIDQTQLELSPASSAPVTLNFIVPKEITSGDYYGSLLLTSGAEKATIPFTIRVLGSFEEKIILEEVTKSGTKIDLKVANQGNRTSKVYAKLKISDLLGTVDQLQTKTLALRAGEIANLETNHKTLLPGIFQTEIALIYGDKQTQSTSLFSFWIWPQFFILFVVITLGALIFTWKKLKGHHV